MAEAQLLGTKNLERNYMYDAYCPVHGSKRKLRRKLVDMHNLVASLETTKDNNELLPILNR